GGSRARPAAGRGAKPMKSRSRIMIQAGAGTPAPRTPGASRRFALHDREWLLVPVEGGWGEPWRWRRAGFVRRIWTLESERGVHLVLAEQAMCRRRWRAESVRAGWTIASTWNGSVRLTDDGDSLLLECHPGWLFRSRIEPASGPDLTW